MDLSRNFNMSKFWLKSELWYSQNYEILSIFKRWSQNNDCHEMTIRYDLKGHN